MGAECFVNTLAYGKIVPKVIKDEKRTNRLGREEWIRGAFQMMAESGVASISVEALAKHLGITKGSFYWHFKDRQDLLDAILEQWHHQLVISRVEAMGGDARSKLRNLLNIVPKSNRFARGGSLELAMRSWARHDEAAAKTVARVDQERLDYTAALFRELGLDEKLADARAYLLYSYVFCQGVFTFEDNDTLNRRVHDLCVHMIEGRADDEPGPDTGGMASDVA